MSEPAGIAKPAKPSGLRCDDMVSTLVDIILKQLCIAAAYVERQEDLEARLDLLESDWRKRCIDDGK